MWPKLVRLGDHRGQRILCTGRLSSVTLVDDLAQGGKWVRRVLDLVQFHQPLGRDRSECRRGGPVFCLVRGDCWPSFGESHPLKCAQLSVSIQTGALDVPGMPDSV